MTTKTSLPPPMTEREFKRRFDITCLSILAGLAIVGTLAFKSVQITSRAVRKQVQKMAQQKAERVAKEQAYLQTPASLIDAQDNDLFLDTDGDKQTTEAVLRVEFKSTMPLKENYSKLAAIHDMTNGTTKTIADWKKFGCVHDVR